MIWNTTRLSVVRFGSFRNYHTSHAHLYKIAIVGSGPSGCYTAKYLQSAFEKTNTQHSIDLIERLPTPYGLVRYGVAADHPEVKNVQNDFDLLFRNGVSFYGNVQVGKDVSVEDLRKVYDAVVLAYGCESDRKLNITGNQLHGVLSAREFVAWYNGHPDFVHIGERVAQALGTEEPVRQASVVVIGQGNVALDCARILAKGKKGLYNTDIASHALDVIGNGVAQTHIIGRRGHVQGAFTIKELRELTKLDESDETAFHVRKDELDLGMTDASKEELSGPSGRPRTRIDKLLQDAASKAIDSSLPKSIHLRFLLNPSEVGPSASDTESVGTVTCERTELVGAAGKQQAQGTGVFETIPADLVLVSIGYKGTAVFGTEQWFDEKSGRMLHQNGMIDQGDQDSGGLYTAGWLKRGPSGIIGTNIADAKDTVASILRDFEKRAPMESRGSLPDLLVDRSKVVDWQGYQKIVQKEREHKRSPEQPREKITDLAEQLSTALN